MSADSYATTEQIEKGFATVRESPRDEGSVKLIVRRPRENEREVIAEAQLDPLEGLLGDNWKSRGSTRTTDGRAHPEMQLNIANARMIGLLASPDRWPLAGDQLYLDFDLTAENLPAGTLLAIGSAIVEVTPVPHLGCKKFQARFGADALKFINAPERHPLRLRGLNAKIVQAGIIRIGDLVRKTG